MVIRRIKNSTIYYEEVAKRINKKDLKSRHYVNGRKDENTEIRKNLIKKNLTNHKKSFESILDVGCGDGSVLIALEELSNRLIGVLPSFEEINLTKSHLRKMKIKNIDIIQGVSKLIKIDSKNIDLIICNAVFQMHGFTKEEVYESIKHFSSLQKKGGTLYIGELPQIEENFYKREKSLIKKIKYFFKSKNVFKTIILYIYHYLFKLFSKRVFYIESANMFYIPIEQLEKVLNKYGYKIIKLFHSYTNVEIIDKKKLISGRVDYLCKKYK